jgi:hypothetical protein
MLWKAWARRIEQKIWIPEKVTENKVACILRDKKQEKVPQGWK